MGKLQKVQVNWFSKAITKWSQHLRFDALITVLIMRRCLKPADEQQNTYKDLLHTYHFWQEY